VLPCITKAVQNDHMLAGKLHILVMVNEAVVHLHAVMLITKNVAFVGLEFHHEWITDY
jgi:hypothetical protein